MKWLWLLLIPLTGCLGAEPDDAPAMPAPEPEPETPAVNETAILNLTAPSNKAIPYTARNCDSVVFVHAVDFPVAQALLPLGFVAADLGELLNFSARLDRGAIGLVTYSCEYDSGADGPVVVGSVNVFVDAPVIDGKQTDPEGIFINAYELHRISSNASMALRYEAAGWSISSDMEGLLTYYIREPLPEAGESRQPNPLVATSEANSSTEELWSGGISGATTYHLKDKTSRFWHVADGGISYDEYTINKQGRGALSECSYGPMIAGLLGVSSCETGENLGLGFQAFDIVGTVHHLPGIYP